MNIVSVCLLKWNVLVLIYFIVLFWNYQKYILMKHENQQTKILQAMVMAVNPKKKEKTIKGDQCDPAKDLPTVKSVFSLGHKEKKIVNGQNLP